MRNHLSLKELSAYIDGEARRPETVSAHLQACTDCEDRYRELVALSERLHAIPVMGARPGFVGRVLRALDDATPARTPARMPLRVAAVVAMTLFMSVTLLSVYYSNRSVPLPAPVAVSTPTTLPMTLAQQEEAWILEIEQLVTEQPVYDTPLLAYNITNDGAPAVATVDDMLLALMEDDTLLQFGQAWIEEEDFDTTVNKLDSNQTETLKSLLREYVEKTNAI